MITDSHLVLIGLMGAGKSTVGARCAARLGRGFLDTDAIVETNAGATISELFAREGEDGFRARERLAVADAMASPEPLVIACGGGAMVDPVNRQALNGVATVIWLQAAPTVLAARVDADGTDLRPLLARAPTAITLTRLADARHDAYEAVADAVVTTDGKDLDVVTNEVLDAFSRADS